MTNERVTVQVDAIGNFSNIIGEVGKFRTQLQNLKLPDKLTTKLEKGFDNVEAKVSHFQSLLNKGITTKGDFSKLISSARTAETAINGLKDDIKSIGDKDIQIAVANSADVKKAEEALQRVLNMEKQLSSFGTSKGKGVFGEAEVANMQKLANTSEGLRKRFDDVTKAIKAGDIERASAALQKLTTHAEKYQAIAEKNGKDTSKWDSTIKWAQSAQTQIDGLVNKATQARNAFEQIKLDKFAQMKGSVDGVANGFIKAASAAKQFMAAETEAASRTNQLNEQVGHLRTQANYFFGLQNMGRLIARGIREAAESVRDLDKAMTETAVVTEFSVGDMWNMLPEYTKLANKLGATTQGAYETMTLYFQQGLNKQQTFEIGEETMKMARIAGLDYAQTTNMMTAALRGFNMELNQTSAKRVNDVYSELAAITASDTRELGLAMERTASIAHSANMDFGATTAFLAQMIETTREAPENLGTAMKTIIARFQELKANPYEISEVEGEEVDFNRVDKALKSIGVDLMDNRDKFRDLDDVFMDISSRWDGLSQTQQRYVATIAAGARQQSRFLAMVQNYDRLKQLVDAAANSEGASEVQFAKTLESYEAKVNKLKNAWQAFTMSLANNKAVKGGVDLLQKIITLGNKIIQVFGKVGSHFGEIGKTIGEMVAAFGLGAAGFKGLQFGANTGLGMLAKMTTGNKMGGRFFMGGAGSRSDGMVTAKITNPIVNAINRVTAAIQKQPFRNQAYQDAKSRSDLLRTRRGNIYGILREEDPTKSGFRISDKTGRQKYEIGYKNFNANQIKKQLGGLSLEEQQAIYKSTPLLQKALQRGYADAYKNLDLDKDGVKALNKHWQHMNQKIQSGEISARDGLRQLYNPALVAQDIREMAPEASKQIRSELTKQIKSWSPDFNKKVTDRLFNLAAQKGLQGREAQEFVADRQRYIAGLQMKNGEAATSHLTKAEGAISKIGSGASSAGQSVMGLGMALSSAGFTGAGSILMTVGNGIMGIGMAAEGATTAVSALGKAFGFLKATSLIGPIGLAVAALGGITAAMIKFGNDHKKAIEKTRKDSKKVLSDYEKDITDTTRNINKLNDSKDAYAQLSQGVDKNNNNVSLGTEEYADYLQIINEIAKMHPEMVKGYNAHGQAILKETDAVNKAIKAEQERQQAAEETFANYKSLDKLIAGRNTTKRWQVGQDLDRTEWNGYTNINKHQDSKLKKDSQAVINSIKNLKGGQELLDNMAQQFGLNASDFTNLSDAGIKAIQQHGANMLDQVESQLGNASDKTTKKLIKNVQDSIAQVGEDTEGIEAVTEPIYKSLSTFASQEGLFDNIPDEFRDAAERGLKEISKLSVDEFGNEITGQAMQRMARDLGNNIANLGGHATEYQNILSDVEAAQNEYVQNLNEEDYLNDDRVSSAIANLQQWADEARAYGDETHLILAETFENQLDSIKNFTDEGAAILSEGFNTFSDIITAANGSFEDFQKQIEGGDFYTGANAFKQIFDEIQDDIDNVGKGSQTWWKGAEKLLGMDNENIQKGNFEAAEKQVKALEPMFEEGQKGADAFFDHVATKQTETFDTMSGTVEDLFKVAGGQFDIKLNDLNSEQFADLANQLGMSDQMLAAMLNKAKQFYNIDFSNVDVLREALATSESTITGVGKTGENTNLYTKQSTFEAEAEAQNYTRAEIADLKDKLTDKGIKLVKDAKDINKDDMKNYIEGMGIKTGEQFVDSFSKLGFSRDELSSLYEKYGGLEGMQSESGQNFQQMYTDYLKTQETAALEPDAKAASELETTNSLLTGILAAVGGIQLGSGQKELENVVGKKGENDTAAQRFGEGLNASNNKFINEQEYATAKKALETEMANNQRIIDGLAARKNELHGSEKKAIEDEIAAYQKANQVISANLQEGEEKYNQLQREKQTQDEVNRSKAENLQKVKEAQDALKTDGFNINDAFGLGEGEVSQASLQFSNIINTLKQSGVEVNNLGSALQSLGPGGLEKISNTDLGNIISDLKLTEEQAAAINKINPELNVKATVDSTEYDKTEKKIDEDTKKPKEQTVKVNVQDNTNKDNKQSKNVTNKSTTTNNVTLNTTITNPEEPKQKIDAAMPKNYSTTVKTKISMSASVSAKGLASKMQAKADSASKGLKVKTGASAKVTATVSGEKNVKNLNDSIKKISGKTVKVKADVSGKSQVDSLKNAISNLKNKTVTVTYKQKGKPSGGDTTSIGVHNYIQHQAPIHAQSLANGTKNGRRKINNFNGGLTLTGEKGFEIAWLPSQNRSMILGSEGPQMVNLPKDAVVWSNEQSKKILKQKAIPAASMKDGYTASGSGSYGSSGSSSSSNKKKSKKSDKKNDKDTKKNNKKAATNNENASKVIQTAGKINYWWWNMTKKVEATQRKIDKLAKKLEVDFKKIGQTFGDSKITETIEDYRKVLNKQKSLNNTMMNAANKSLTTLKVGNKTVAANVSKEQKKVDKAEKKVKAAQNKYNKAKGKANKKAAKKELDAAKKQLTKAKKNRDAKKTGVNYASISYDVTQKTKNKKGKWTSKKVTKKEKINLAPYITQDAATGAYQIDYKKINKAFGKNGSKTKAIGEAAKKLLEDYQDKYNTAEDNYTKAQEALDKLNNDIYETFDRWEKSITEVYLLSQKLEEISKKLSIAGSQADLQFAKLETGIVKSVNALPKIQEALDKQRENLLTQAQGKYQLLEETQKEFTESLDLSTYIKKYYANKNSSEAKGDYQAAYKALAFLKNVNLEGESFDYSAAVAALDAQHYNEETNNQIKSVLDKIFEKQNSYLDAVNDAYEAQKEIYDTLEEYQSFIADFEQELLSGIEEQAEDQINRLDKLNSSLSKAFKDLIDEVKNRLEARRREEDNAKTESNIAKKQQRLAALRADTSGGHAVEIAKLEQEIAEAQQSYQRTLEDQLLDRLQEQGDKAERQRERQIELLEMQKEIAKQTGTNLEQVRLWLQNPEDEENKAQIRQAWLANKNYEEATPGEQKQLEEEFEAEWSKYLAYYAQMPQYEQMINSSVSSAAESLLSLEDKVDLIANNLLGIKGDTSAKAMRERGVTAKELYNASYKASSLVAGGYNTKDIINAGYKKSALTEAGINPSKIKQWNKDNPNNKISVSSLRSAGFTAKEVNQAGYTDKEIKQGGYTVAQFKQYKSGATGAKAAVSAGYSQQAVAKTYGSTLAMTALNMSGKSTQTATKASAKTLQSIVNKSKTDEAKQKDMAGVQGGKVDVNGEKKGGIIKDSHLSAGGGYIGANKGSTLYTKDWDESKGQAKSGAWTTIPIGKLSVKHLKSYPIDAKQALESAIKNTKVGSVINKNFKALITTAKLAGKVYKLKNGIQASIGSNGKIYYNKGTEGVQIWDPATGKLKLQKFNAKDFKKASQYSTVGREYKQVNDARKKKKLSHYKTGGLATQTGPAWLDGTPSKPELVLNAQDTKNFLTLRDVLDKAISSTNTTSNTYGDTMYEININVDHINSDYDVDKIADKVKKEIVKTSGYRNVTQVRNFR